MLPRGSWSKLGDCAAASIASKVFLVPQPRQTLSIARREFHSGSAISRALVRFPNTIAAMLPTFKGRRWGMFLLIAPATSTKLHRKQAPRTLQETTPDHDHRRLTATARRYPHPRPIYRLLRPDGGRPTRRPRCRCHKGRKPGWRYLPTYRSRQG